MNNEKVEYYPYNNNISFNYLNSYAQEKQSSKSQYCYDKLKQIFKVIVIVKNLGLSLLWPAPQKTDQNFFFYLIKAFIM